MIKKYRIMMIIAGVTISFFVISVLFLYKNSLYSKQQYHKTTLLTSSENPQPTIPVTEDNRILLSLINIRQYNKWTKENCQEDFNTAPANQWVQYSDSQLGVKFKVPYNALWGSSRFRINPYEEYESSILFGPYSIWEACSWFRSYQLKPVPHLSFNDAFNSIKSDPATELSAKKININGLDVITYSPSDEVIGGCQWPTFRVIGRKFDYVLSPQCGQNGDFKILEEVIQTMEIGS